MRAFLVMVLLSASVGAGAQPSLPPCPADTAAYWHNCFGTITWSSGAKYVGEWRDNKRHGQATNTWPSGEKYVGEWRDDKLHGQGTYTWPSGEKYVGEWRDDKLHGEGVRYSASGAILESGRWNSDKLVQAYMLDRNRFPFDPSNVERDLAENRRRQEQQARLEAEAKERARVAESERRQAEAVRVAAEARERDRKIEEARQLAEARERAEQRRRDAADRPPERRVAMVIGNSAYKVNPLDNPANDATDMATALRGLGFEVTLLRNASLSQMRAATRKFEEAVLGSDVALIYYAGHGIEAKGRNYMIPVSADVQREFELDDQAYNASQWLDMLEGAKGRNAQRVNIVILDACRNNTLSRSWRAASQGLARMDAPSGTVLVYSTAPGKVAADGDVGQRNSPFTKHLLQSMQTANLPIEQVLKETRRRVMAETKGEQVPWENSSLVGDFVFRIQR